MQWLTSSKHTPAATGSAGRKPGHPLLEALLTALYRETGIRQEHCRPRLAHYASYAAIRELPEEQQRQLVFLLSEKIIAFERRAGGRRTYWDLAGKNHFIHDLLLRYLLRCALEFSAAEFRTLFEWCRTVHLLGQPVMLLPVPLLVRQLERRLAELPLTAEWQELLAELRAPRFAAILPIYLRSGFRSRAVRRLDEEGKDCPDEPEGTGDAG